MKLHSLCLSLITVLLGLISSEALAGASKTPNAAAFADPDKSLMVPVEGGRVYVRVNGSQHSAAIPAVFIHGGPGGTHNYFAGVLGLADERPVIFYDQLDSGKSDQPNDPKNWRVERFVDELESIRKALGFERWHLVGQSWGSALALEYSVRFPERVASTALTGTFISTPHWVMDANILIQQAPQSVQQTLTQCETDTPPSADQCEGAFVALYSSHYVRPAPNPARLAYDKQMGGKGFNPKIYKAMWGPSEFSSTGSLKHYDAVPLLKKIDGNKTLFVIGQYDSARIDTVQEYLLLAPGAEFAVVPGASHGMYSDRPVVMEGILRSWFSRND